jgi:hypothetical protein
MKKKKLITQEEIDNVIAYGVNDSDLKDNEYANIDINSEEIENKEKFFFTKFLEMWKDLNTKEKNKGIKLSIDNKEYSISYLKEC